MVTVNIDFQDRLINGQLTVVKHNSKDSHDNVAKVYVKIYADLCTLHKLLSKFKIISIISLKDAKRFLINDNFPKVWKMFDREY